MKLNQYGIDLIKHFEGCELIAYRDSVGVLTIGYGHTKNVYATEKITNKEAEDLLVKDLEYFCNQIKHFINITLNDNQFSALVSFAYNLGVGALAHSHLLALINEKKDFIAAAHEFTKWNHAGGHVLVGLTKRRQAESDLFLKPETITT